MKVEYIRIEEIPSYRPNAGAYEGQIKYRGEHGTIQIQLDAQLSHEVLKLVAESLTRATKELANDLTAAVFEQTSPALENKDA